MDKYWYLVNFFCFIFDFIFIIFIFIYFLILNSVLKKGLNLFGQIGLEGVGRILFHFCFCFCFFIIFFILILFLFVFIFNLFLFSFFFNIKNRTTKHSHSSFYSPKSKVYFLWIISHRNSHCKWRFIHVWVILKFK